MTAKVAVRQLIQKRKIVAFIVRMDRTNVHRSSKLESSGLSNNGRWN